MKRIAGLVGGLLAGAGLMYLFDPDRGVRRRALVREQATSARRRATRTLAEAQQRWHGEDVPDAVLAERVRARLGLVCSAPTALEVTAHEGCVTLRGSILRSELAPVVRAAKWARGVRMVDDQLEARDPEATSAASERERLIGH